MFGNTGGIESSKNSVPNMMNILSQDGVSIENLEFAPLAVTNLENPSKTSGLGGNLAAVSGDASASPSSTPPVANPLPIEPAIEASNSYKKTFEEVFGPKSAEDVSQFLYTLMLMRKADYLPELGVDSLIGQFILYALQGLAGETSLRPNQIIKLLDMLLDQVPQNELSNPAVVSEYRKKYDNYANLANLIVNYTTLVKVEYFIGYAPIDGSVNLGYNLNQPKFQIFDSNAAESVVAALDTNDKMVLMRIRSYDDAAKFKLNDNFKLPIFNQYFLLKK